MSADQVGSTRLVTSAGGAVVSRHDYLPFGYDFGDNYGGNNTGLQNSGWGQADGVAELFTGKERDAESGPDYFGAQYYGLALGRFTSLDPLPG